MTVPFYTHEELQAAIAKERLWISAELLRIAAAHQAEVDEEYKHCAGQTISDEAYCLRLIAPRIAKGDYPRPLVVDPTLTSP
jgi:hypothetical protein